MSSMQPTQDSINSLIEFFGLSSAQAVFLLQKHHNNADQAMNDFLDNGDGALQYQPPPKEHWQETDNMPTFQIDRDDTASSSIRAAASRPPSRTSFNQEPIDLSAAHAAADPSKVLSLQEQEEMDDRQLREVLEKSKLDYTSVQENGVTGTGQQFGPATGANYEQNKWAMVPSNANHVVREVFEHPRPSKRRRLGDEPVFLRGAKETGYLAALLTIYHSIPLAREALLLPSMKVHAYGHDPNWWNGTSDENDKSVSVEDSNLDKDRSNFLCEIQSLMAFLDESNRAYGSVDALADLRAYKAPRVQEPYSFLMEVWKQAAMQHKPDEQLTQIFNSYAEKAGFDPANKDFAFLDPPISTLNEFDTSLYSILDDAIWNDNYESSSLENIWVGHCAEIFTICLRNPTNGKNGLRIKIPAIWYSDRYLEECQSITWDMRNKKKQIYNKITKLMRLQYRYQNMTINHDGRNLNIPLILSTAKEAAALAVKDKVLPNGVLDEMQPLLSNGNTISQSQLQECQADLQNVLDRIDRKLRLLDQRIQECREQNRLLGQTLTQESADPSQPPHHRYFLQGVSTLSHVTYVRRRIEEELIDLDDDPVESGEEKNEWQWWRISFSREDVSTEEFPMAGPVTQAEAQAAQMASVQGTIASDMLRKIRQPSNSADAVGYSVRKVREYEVLKAAREENHQVLLVYADEHAINFRGSELSPALKAFIKRDNHMFENELRNEQMEQEATAFGSGDGTENHIFEDVPLDGSGGEATGQASTSFFSREMTPMSMSSPKRDLEWEEESSPKRPKSSNGSLPALTGSEDPPAYEEIAESSGYGQEMQEKSGGGSSFLPRPSSNRIGQHSEKMMRFVEDAREAEESKQVAEDGNGLDVVHIEHSTTPLR